MDRGYRGAGRGNAYRGGREQRPPVQPVKGTRDTLLAALRSIDHRGYPAYKELTGSYAFADYTLGIDHVQGDPFAQPSLLHLTIPPERAKIPQVYTDVRAVRTAVEDDLLRCFAGQIAAFSGRADGSGKSGVIFCSKPGQEVLERSACQIGAGGSLTFRFHVGFPAAGRTILAGELEKILFDFLPKAVLGVLRHLEKEAEQVRASAFLAKDQESLRAQMAKAGYAAFVADGSILPRQSGVSQKPMRDAVPFASPESLRVSFDLPHAGTVTGMGIPTGITLIIGGGYHGKSTLLEALERGVYNHIRGDGREFVLCDASAVKVRAEDGRNVTNCDTSAFIRNLPSGKDTVRFSSADASGSTSQASAVIEAVEAGSKVLLMDEDTCATNFMVRDELMQKALDPGKEPITPYLLRMRELYEKDGISTILAAGSSGAFFAEADLVIQMDAYVPVDVTQTVKRLAEEEGSAPGSAAAPWKRPDFTVRKVTAAGELMGARDRVKTKTLGKERVLIGHEETDLRALEQLVSEEQTRAILALLLKACSRMEGSRSVTEIVSAMEEALDSRGLSALGSPAPADLARPRPQELAAALCRIRSIRIGAER